MLQKTNPKYPHMYCLQAWFTFTKSLSFSFISEDRFHHTPDFWLLTWAENWEQLSCFSAYPGSSAQQKSQGIWWPQHKAAFCSAYLQPTREDGMAGPAAGKALHTMAQLHARSAPRKILPWHRDSSSPHSPPKWAEILDLSSHSVLPTDTVSWLSLFAAA